MSLTAPTNAAVYTAPASIPISAVALPALIPSVAAERAKNDPQAIVQVEFFAGTTLIGAVAGPQTGDRYSLTWINPAPGVYSITARATNEKGDAAISGAATITVNAPPTVSLSSAAAVVTAPGTINLTAAPADTDGTIQKVDFFRGTTLVGTATAAPFSVQLENLAASTYSFTARATDNHGATGDSAGVTVIVNDRPTVELRSSTALVTAPGSITLTAFPADTDGTIQKVEFFQGSTPVGTATASPYQLELANLEPGTYTFTALATDNHAATGSSIGLAVRVNSPPNVSLTSISASFRAPASVPLSAIAFDPDGTIVKVEFFNGAELIATLTADPFNVVWGQVPQGTYTLTARVTDDLGASASSEPLAVTVNAAKGKLYFIHVDHLNTPRLVANEIGTIVWRWVHSDPFGGHAPDENPSGLGVFQLDLRLPGQYLDREVDLHYNYSRHYDPWTGRYVESDPIGLEAGLNTYAYVLSNPLSYFDPFGLKISVCYYSDAAAGFGHIGYAVGEEPRTFGYYPTASAFGSLGIIKQDDQTQMECKVIESTPDQDRCMLECRARRQKDPGTYDLTTNQCTRFVRECLSECGLPTGNSSGNAPRNLFLRLPGRRQ